MKDHAGIIGLAAMPALRLPAWPSDPEASRPCLKMAEDEFTDTQAIAAIARITDGNLRLLQSLFARIERVMGMARVRLAAAPDGHVQALDRSGLVAKVRDVVGLYMAPPDHALVLCVGEKSRIQALDRSQPMLPMHPGQPARRSHDHTRHGTTSLFAALDVVTGRVIGECYPRHRAAEFRRFLDRIEANVPRNLDVHLVMSRKSPGFR